MRNVHAQSTKGKSGQTPAAPVTFPAVAATRCTCCGIELTRGTGYDVPFIGPVGPKCARKFAAFAGLLGFVEGRTADPTLTDEARLASYNLIVGLRVLGFEVADHGGVLHVARMTRKPAQVAKSWKKRRAEFERDLQIAAGLFGEDARLARAAA